MKHIANLLILSISYSFIIVMGIAAGCGLSLYQCELSGGEFVLKEWLMPGIIVFTGLVIVGIGVAYVNILIASSQQRILRLSVVQFILGSFVGLLPLLFFHVVTKSLSVNYRPSFQEVPFLLGGFVVVLLIKIGHFLRRKN